MADITIKHTRAEGTLVHGSEPDDGILELLNPFGFRYARTVGFIYLRGSRDRASDQRRIRGAKASLETEGHTVTLDIDETVRRSFQAAEQERYVRAGSAPNGWTRRPTVCRSPRMPSGRRACGSRRATRASR